MMHDVLGNIQNSVLSSSQFSDKGTKGCVFLVNVFELNLFLNNRVNAVEKSGLKLQFNQF